MGKKIIILGAGLVGSLLSILLAKKGYEVTVYEKRPDPRKTGAEGGRSINLALSARGKKALAQAGVMAKVDNLVIGMEGRMMHDVEGRLNFLPYGAQGQEIYSISRAGLNELLMTEAENLGVTIYFQMKVVDLKLAPAVAIVQNEAGNIEDISADFILGTDGAFSVAREVLRMTDRFNYSQYYIDYGYKELTIPATADNDFALDSNALHIWPRGNYMLIALPNLDKSFTCTLFLPFEGEQSFEKLTSENKIVDFFEQNFPDATAKMPNLINDFMNNPVASLVTINCYPWVKGNIALLGDAAHAIVPFYGQGMNAGFEDCYIFFELLEKFGDDWQGMLQEFQMQRKPDADAISELALRNFVEMRDLVADPKFLLRKKIESKLHAHFPEDWIPLYSMVTFSSLRYSEALRIGKLQDKIMEEVIRTPGVEHNWENLNLREIRDKLRQVLE